MESNIIDELRSKVRMHLEKKCISMREFSATAKIAPSTLSRWLRGELSMSEAMLRAIIRAMD